MSTLSETQEERGLARLAQRSAAWTEKWFPDAYVFALAGVVLVSVAAMANGSSPATVAETFGGGFWDLATFTLQMAMVVLTGYVVATSPPVARLIARIALVPSSPRGAVAFVALLSSAAQLQATPASLPPELLEITGVLDFGATILTWQSLLMAAILIALSVAVAWASAPRGEAVKTAEDLGVDLDDTVPPTAGVLVQFPLYAAMAAILTRAEGRGGMTVSEHLADLFTGIGSSGGFAVVIALYTALLGILVPSGGGKWLVEAPYVMQSATDVQMNLGWTVQIYNAAEALPNLVNPFFMLPLLAVLGLRARDLVGFTFLQFLFHLPVVLLLLWLLGMTFEFVPPVMP